MPFADWMMAGVFACMALAIVVDQRAPRHAPAGGHTPRPAAAVRAPAPAAALAELLREADGWALVGPDGALLATNLQRRVALLAAACAALRLSDGAEDQARLQAPGGALLAGVSPEGFVLSVLLTEGRDQAAASAAMSVALRLSAHLWSQGGANALPGGPSEAIPVRRAPGPRG